MIDYNELYELLRKEKYSEALQPLPKDFIKSFREYVNLKRGTEMDNQPQITSKSFKSRRELENSITLFHEIMSKRRSKILRLAFVATKTGIMKRDYENMLEIEREMFENIVKEIEKEEEKISKMLKGDDENEQKSKLVIFTQDVEQFVVPTGEVLGPFKEKELANLDGEIANILVDEGRAIFVNDEG
ncbi:DNA replication complex GINS family protein [Candidatus Pacearchaeota archaeon]|nr:MAG: DNA replication complex GINS family protein [Candidatus Pacearchaeota archaeon]